MYAKFENGQFIRAPYRISDADALAQGFKPVVLTPAPETDDTHYPVERLEETESKIVRHWDIEELPPIEPEPLTDEEALTRYANSITGANDPDLISAAETLIEQRIKEEK